ncbi:Extended synaptotagmin-2 [Nymphon striatum]|nr:Extended synaptotagmin-2 [Nymphon striatum]
MQGESAEKCDSPSSSAARESSQWSILTLFGSFLKGASFLGSAYALGKFDFSPSWVMIAVAVWIVRDKMNRDKKYRLAVGREAVINEKQTVLARIDDLPSWVFFPDVERAEWLNKILHKLWPHVGGYIKELIQTSIEPSIRNNLPSYLKGFKFETVDLGNIPLRIGGVKVYSENVSRGEIVMDLEIFYSGDCHLVVKVKNIRAGIKDLQIHGTVRVIMKPLVKQMPLIGGLSVFFLSNPAIDFNLTNIADIFDMPGLSDTLRRVITEQIAAYMVLPNKIPVPLIAGLPSKILKFSPPAGVLEVHVIEARALRKADISLTGKGKSDPFAVITVGAQTFQTNVIDDTVEPFWNFSCEAIVDQLSGQTIDIDIYDEDSGSKNDFLGCVMLDIGSIAHKGVHDTWIPLESAKTGELHIRTVWKSLSDTVSNLHTTKKELEAEGGSHKLSSALLLVYVDSAKDLPSKAKTMVEPNPNVKLTVGNKIVSTLQKYKTNNPVWEESFNFLLSDPELQDISIEVKQDDPDKENLGNMKFNISQLVKDGETDIEQDFRLEDSGPNSTINLSLKLKFYNQVELNPTAPNTPTESKSDDAGSKAATNETVNDQKLLSTNLESNSEKDGPPEEEIIRSTSVSPVMSAPLSTESTLRQRVVGSGNHPKKGRIQLTLRYSDSRNKFIVVVHKAADLVADPNDDQPDPYVKLYLLPDKSKDSKCKTSVCKNTLNPVFDETLDFTVSHSELSKHSLHLSVNSKSSSGVFSKSKTTILGQVLIGMSDVDLNKATTEWFDLEPSNE